MKWCFEDCKATVKSVLPAITPAPAVFSGNQLLPVSGRALDEDVEDADPTTGGLQVRSGCLAGRSGLGLQEEDSVRIL